MVKGKNIRYIIYSVSIILCYLLAVIFFSKKLIYINSMYQNAWKICFYLFLFIIGLLCTLDFPFQEGAGRRICVMVKTAVVVCVVIITIAAGYLREGMLSLRLMGTVLAGIQCGYLALLIIGRK